MDEPQTQEPTDAVKAEVKTEENAPTRLQNFVNKHPRAAKVTAIIGAVTTAAGALHFARTVHSNKEHLELAGAHASDALDELAATTSPDATEA